MLSGNRRTSDVSDEADDGAIKVDGQRAENEFTFSARRVSGLSGLHIGRCYSTKTGKAYLGTRPSKKSIRKLTAKVSQLTASRRTLLDAEVVVRQLNELLTGWSQYFCLDPVDKSYRVADAHTTHRLRQWLRRKHKISGSGAKRYPDEYLYESLGLIQLRKKPQNLPWAKA